MAFIKLKFGGGRKSPTEMRRQSGIGGVASNFGVSKKPIPKPSADFKMLNVASDTKEEKQRTYSNSPLDLSTNTTCTVDLSSTSRTSSVFVDVEYVKSALASNMETGSRRNSRSRRTGRLLKDCQAASEDVAHREAQRYLDTPIHTQSRLSVLRLRRSRGLSS
ncbi:hypothetical protein THAOC_01152 [Thalassiosira oceanica]|uniref:Uncharacterized protein n=1 Tax=Thalassiosira oceanica TaxID=159749 RepID=K0TND4_THAOC|nr:hypothetical protein THAOC_01152 [Thalassiosira oceanica]|eukprot:EJK77041.1 hypothetical protein THAOC_01152 [Thalassiosira oceanica]